MADKTKLLVEEISNEMQRLKSDIMDTAEMFKQRRETVEKHCSQCRGLFKPWPRKIVQMYSSDNATDEKLDEIDEKPCNFSLKAEDELEKHELAMLDDILAKAQHARDIQTKMSKPKKSHSGLKKSSNLPGTKSSQRTTSHTTEAKSKPKVSYPVLKRPSSAKSTYATSYMKPARTKTPGTGSKKSSSTSMTSTTANQELKKQREQDKTTDLKLHEAKKSTENLSKDSKPEDKLSKPSQSSDCANPEPGISKTVFADTRFLISEKGSTLSMPTEFQGISRDHKMLQRRVEKAKSFTARESEEQFIKKAEELFCPKLLSFPSILELREETQRLEEEYEGLLSLVKTLGLQRATEANKVRGNCYEDWGTLMLKFKLLNHEAEILKENLSTVSMYCPFSDHKPGFALVFEKQDSLLVRVQGCSLKAAGDGLFTYHNTKELKTLLKLSYDYKIMKYQFNLRKLVGEALLPLLQQMPENHKSFVPLCRSLYSILCCEGKTFPTLVKDSLPED